MKLYRFSPIESKEQLLEAIEHLHFASYQLCQQSFGEHLPVAGNVGVFCHYDNEYDFLISVRDVLVELEDNWNQKYFKLKEPIMFTAKDGVPETTYEYLYIRKPDPYRHHVGDIDFFIPDDDYIKLKERARVGEIPGARVFPEDRLDMIELHHPDNDAIAYVTTSTMAEKVRSTHSSHTP